MTKLRRVSAQSRRFAVVLALGMVLAALGPIPNRASAEVIDVPLGIEGCLDSTAVAVGMHNNVVEPAGGVSLVAPGPVVAALVEWTGKFETAVPPAADTTLGIEVTGPSGTNGDAALDPDFTASDSAVPDPAGFPQIYTYATFITDLFGDGSAGT